MTDFEPIVSDVLNPRRRGDSFDLHLDVDDKDQIKNLLLGHKVTKVSDDHLVLDDGTVLKLFGQQECCAGYELTELNGVDNIITEVSFVDDPAGDEFPDGEGVYQIFVFADNQQVNLATFEGSDGNGYYGTGYHIQVRRPR